jgi:hypothetical protein
MSSSSQATVQEPALAESPFRTKMRNIVRCPSTLKSHVRQAAAEDRSPLRARSNARIMYIERKAGELTGEARIGLVRFSRSGGTLYYRGQRFQSLKGAGFKANYFDVDSGEEYWISGPRRDGCDRLYGERLPVEIDGDVQGEYWTKIRER